MPSYLPVAALLRGLEVLRIVNRSGVTTVKEIHYETGTDKATIVRMLETLIHAGYVSRKAESGTYGVTGRVLQLSSGFVHHVGAGEICGPILMELRDKIGWPSGFSMPDHDAMVVVQTSRDVGSISFNRNPGYRLPMLQASVGKVYLAYCPGSERERILSRLIEISDRSQQISLTRIEATLKRTRRAGFAVSEDSYIHREFRGTLWGMAVPVMDDSNVYGALNIILLRNAVTVDQAQNQYLAQMQSTAKKIVEAFRSAGI